MKLRSVRVVLAAAFLALVSVPANAGAVDAANGVDVRGSTTYTLVPASRVVRVAIDLTVRNVTRDTASFRYYYTAYGVGIHGEATAIKASRGGRALQTTVTSTRGYKVVNVRFGRQLFSRQSFRFRLDYQLPDGGARSKSTIRVGRAFAGFYGYAYGEEAASVRIVLPPGFKVTTREGDRLATATDGGRTVLTARNIAKPTSWWVYVAADSPAALRQETFNVTIGSESKPVTVKAWPEDDRWIRTVRARLEGGLPILGQMIGLPWPVEDTLEVAEVFSPLLGGYAGIYYEPESQIRITEDPDELVVLHEASHAWFNGDLARERWINEGLADEYAARTLARLGSSGYQPESVDRGSKAAFPLNEWPAPRSVNDAQTEAREKYGYNASWLVMRRIVGEIGETKMRDVFEAAAGREIAYVGEGEPEIVTSAEGADWRTFLDLLEERGGSATARTEFGTWVVSKADTEVLADRTAARRKYGELVREGATWKPPYSLRLQMARWNFDAAEERITLATGILEGREQISALAQSLEVKTTQSLEDAYEGRRGELLAARQLADDQLATLEAMDSARDRVEGERRPLDVLGLLGDNPEGALAEARRDFERDDLPGAREAAGRALRLLESAPEEGAGVARLAVGGLVAVVLLAVGFLLLTRRRERGRIVTVTVTGSSADGSTGAAQAERAAPASEAAVSPDAAAPTPEAASSPDAAAPTPQAAGPAAAAADATPERSEPPATLPATFRHDEEESR
jgi:hypothetical protein